MAQAKFAFLFNTTTDQIARTLNGLDYALDLDEAGHDVEIYLDGQATEWPGFLEENPDNVVNDLYTDAVDRDLIDSACGFCANVFEATDSLETASVEVQGGAETHGVDAASLTDDGYDLVVI